MLTFFFVWVIVSCVVEMSNENCCETISAVELLGDGTGVVSAGTVEVTDISVGISRPYSESDSELTGSGFERVWIPEKDLHDHVGVGDPDPDLVDKYDVVVVVSELPVPFEFRETPRSKLSIDLSIAQIENGNARGCPRCGSDMACTFKNGGCSRCGFYFDSEFVSDDRREELDQVFEEYDGANK